MSIIRFLPDEVEVEEAARKLDVSVSEFTARYVNGFMYKLDMFVMSFCVEKQITMQEFVRSYCIEVSPVESNKQDDSLVASQTARIVKRTAKQDGSCS